MYIVIASLRLLNVNLEYLSRQPQKDLRDAILKDGNKIRLFELNEREIFLNKIRTLALRLLAVPLEEGEINPVLPNAVHILLNNLEIFYPTVQARAGNYILF